MEPMENFDPEINRIHTLECLKRLMILYGQDDVCHCRRGQFVALYILYNVDSDDAVFTSLQLKDTLAYEMLCRSLTLKLHSDSALNTYGVHLLSNFSVSNV